MTQPLAQSLVANQFLKPTPVQEASLSFMNARADCIIAAKTGQGKTLCFGIPIIDLLIKRLLKDETLEFNSVKALIMSPTRELAIQIKDHISAIIPVEFE